MRGLLALASAGVLLFLIIEVGYRAMETVEAAAKGGSSRLALHYGLLFVVGLCVGLIGLAWLEQGRLSRKSAGAEALEVATMIAIGIGLHNFAEGLAIGQSFAGGAVTFGTTLVIGFALHIFPIETTMSRRYRKHFNISAKSLRSLEVLIKRIDRRIF